MTPLLAQTVIIVDNEDLKPVTDVAVLNEPGTKFTYSNRLGSVDISTFGEDEMICFRHFTFEMICLSRAELKAMNYRVKLTRKVFALDEFVISADRREQSITEVPNKITTVAKTTAELLNPQTSADLIGISGEVFIQKSQLGGGSPMIRGFATNRILIVVDGVRMNNAIYREGNIQNVISLNPLTVESTEIIFGPGASVYGSDAIGGVMDFHTKKALFSTGSKPFIKAEAFSRYSSAASEKTTHLDLNIGTGKFAFLTSFTWSGYGDLRMGSKKHPEYLRNEYVARIAGKDSVVPNRDPRIQVSSGYNQLNTMNKLRFRISDNTDLIYSLHYSRLSDVPRYDRLIQYRSGVLRYAEWYYGPQIWLMNNLRFTVRKKNLFFDALRITAAQQKYSESRQDRGFGKNIINGQTENVGIVSLNIDLDRQLRKESEFLYYGIEYVFNDVKSDAETRDILTGIVLPAGSRYPNGKNRYNSFALYGGYRNHLSDLITLSTGLRYNYVSLSSSIADNSWYSFPFTSISNSNGALTGSAGIVFRPEEKMQINLNTSTGFRAPNLDDTGKIFDSAPGVVVVPNPDLRPEYAWNIDMGISGDIGDFLHYEVTGFRTWLRNAMVRHDFLFNGQDSIFYRGELSKVESLTNTGSALAWGLHVNLRVKLTGWLSVKSHLNITEGREKSGVQLRHAAPIFGSTHITAGFPAFTLDLAHIYNGPKKFSKMPPSETDKPYMYATDDEGNPWSPGWHTLNFKITGKIGSMLSLSAGLENILDVRYRPYASGIAAPGRNFIISLRINI